MAERFTTQLRVRWSEVDPQGVVFNPNYLVYADVAITDLFRSVGGLDGVYPDMNQSYVVDAHASFRGSARFDEVLDIEVAVSRIGNASYDLRVDIRRDDTLLTEITLTYVRALEGRSEALSAEYRSLLNRLLISD